MYLLLMQVFVAITRNVFPQIRTIKHVVLDTSACVGCFSFAVVFSYTLITLHSKGFPLLPHKYYFFAPSDLYYSRVIRQISDEFIKTT